MIKLYPYILGSRAGQIHCNNHKPICLILSQSHYNPIHCNPNICIHRMLYYEFRFVTPPPQCVERFHHYRSNKKNIKASLLKFAGYIHNLKILPGNIFGLILKNKMATMGNISTFSKDNSWPSRAKGIIGRDFKFAGYDLITKS